MEIHEDKGNVKRPEKTSPSDPLQEGLAAANEKLELYKGPEDEAIREDNLESQSADDNTMDADDAGE